LAPTKNFLVPRLIDLAINFLAARFIGSAERRLSTDREASHPIGGREHPLQSNTL